MFVIILILLIFMECACGFIGCDLGYSIFYLVIKFYIPMLKDKLNILQRQSSKIVSEVNTFAR